MITSTPDSNSDSEANGVYSRDYDASNDFAIRILPNCRIADPLQSDGIWITVDTACSSSCCGRTWRDNADEMFAK
eukprot:5246710-Karenia_brevis.AAC.1